jgi:hypothetical protein
MKKRAIVFVSTILIIMAAGQFVDALHAENGESKYGAFGINADLVSRYVWRGFDFGNSVSVQPALSYTLGGLNVGVWGSYGLAMKSSDYDEIDIFASYSISSKAGTFKPLVTDYTFPYLNTKFFNFDEDSTGSHTIELGLAYTGPDKFPVSVFVGVNVYNDDDNSPYFEVGYPVSLNDVSLNLFAGATKGTSAWYGVDEDEIAVLNIGVTAAKAIAVTEQFSLPVAVTFVVNPYVEKSYLVFKMSF